MFHARFSRIELYVSPKENILSHYTLYIGNVTNDCLLQWDLRLLSTAIPTCNPNDSNIDVSIYHRSGRYDTTCQALEAEYNATNVKSLSYKSPSEDDWHDLCMFSTADCSGGKTALLGSITDGWEVCYPYNGFRGWSVVAHGTACV